MATVAQKLAASLKSIGIRYVFGVPSGNFVDYMEAINETEGLEFVLVSNEASGGFMADACWRLTGSMAACFGTFGPGACNLTTGICCGYLDRSPMLALTDEMTDQMRSRTTQMNIDHQALFEPITKWTTRLDPERVEEIVSRAASIAASEVPGPVHIGIPAGDMALRTTGSQPPAKISPEPMPAADHFVLDRMETVFSKSERPVLALGLTSVRADVKPLVKKIAERYKLPVVLTPMAKGMLSENHPSYAGVLAHALSDHVAKTYQQSDLVIGIGYDPVEINYEDWMPAVPLLNIDTVPADLDAHRYSLACDVVGRLTPSLERLLAVGGGSKQWDLDELGQRRREIFDRLHPPAAAFDARAVLTDLRRSLPEDGIMVCDVGAHLHLIGQQWQTPAPELQLMTNGCSSMGYAIPAAVAAKLCRPEREVCCVVGDGGFLMMAGEMATAMRLGQRVVFILMLDKSLSLIRLKQEKKGYPIYGTPLHGTDYASASTCFGVPVLTAKTRSEYTLALERAFSARGPVIIEAFINSESYDELILRGNR
jgi:acetolactate synthase-1/2/3 large subunit